MEAGGPDDTAAAANEEEEKGAADDGEATPAITGRILFKAGRVNNRQPPREFSRWPFLRTTS